MKGKQFVFLLIAITGCAQAVVKHEVKFNPSEPLRVAVLPFVEVNEKGEVIEPDANLAIDNVALVSTKLEEDPARYVQKLVQNKIDETGLDIVASNLVSSTLFHNGFSREDKSGRVNAAKVLSANKKQLCELMSCDALLYGKVTRWTRSFYAIQSISTVGVSLELVSAKSGNVIFSAQVEDSDSRGLSKGPTGFSSLILEPIKGLDNDIILELADRVVEKALSPLYVKNRPEFLNSTPPTIYSSAFDSVDGELSHAHPLKILLYGSSNQQASFSIGNVVENVPMIEHEGGHYFGEFYPLSTDHFESQPVYVNLVDSFGKSSKQRVGQQGVRLK